MTTPAWSPTLSFIGTNNSPAWRIVSSAPSCATAPPLAVYVDRGKVYTSKQFDTICATLGIQRILASPYYPEGKGKVERFFGFVRADFLPELDRSPVTSLAHLNQSLLAWLEVVYHRKLHSETGQAHLERYRQDPAPATRPVDPTTLRQAFLHRDQRQVTKTAVRYPLRPFHLQETIAYIKHHLRVAGSPNPIFADAFLSGVYDHTKGVPRQINNLCRSALLLGATENKQILAESDLKRVIHDQDGQLIS